MGQTKQQAEFYDTFQMGIELEMEIPDNREISTNTILEFKTDGSLQRKNDNSSCIELINKKIFQSKNDETTFIKEMKRQLADFRSSNGEQIFAYKNNSCGTHIHFSFKNMKPEMLWVFDTIDFEQDFFNAYMSRFQSEKFLNRIDHGYCRAPFLYAAQSKGEVKSIRNDLNKITLPDFVEEKNKISNGSRYRWLNMESLDKGFGLELRVFPHIQTYGGIETILEFTREVINKHYWKKATQERLRFIEFYTNKVKSKSIKSEKLKDLKKLAWDALRISDRSKSDLSGEIRILLAKWIMKQPTLIKTKQDVI